jgi:hypothetical protein
MTITLSVVAVILVLALCIFLAVCDARKEYQNKKDRR